MGKVETIYEYKNEVTCAQFYENRIQKMLEIFSEVIHIVHYIHIENMKTRKLYQNL